MNPTTKSEIDRPLLVTLAVCCALPMIGIIVATSVVGVAVGTAAAVAVGLVVAGVCVVAMFEHHRRGHSGPKEREEQPQHGH